MSRIEQMIADLSHSRVSYVLVRNVATVGTGRSDRKDATADGDYPFFVRSKDALRINSYEFDETAIIIPGEGGVGEIFHYVEGKYALHQRAYRISFTDPVVDPKFAYYYFSSHFKRFILQKAVSATVISIRKPMITDFKIPVPPLEVQRKIVETLDIFTKLKAELEAELEARQKQYSHYRRRLLKKYQSAKSMSLNDVCLSISAGGDRPKKYLKGQTEPTAEMPYPIYSNGTAEAALYGYTDSYRVSQSAVTISARGTIGAHAIREPFFTPIVRLLVLIPNPDIINIRYLNHVLEITEIAHSGGSIPQLTVPNVRKITIPVPDLDEQAVIADQLDKFDALVNDQSSGLPAEIVARRKQYEFYRDRLLTFEELAS